VVENERDGTLLLVEDKTELRTMLAPKHWGARAYTVDEAPDGAAAIHKGAARR